MKRRDSIKTLLIGAVAGAGLTTGVGCQTDGTGTEAVKEQVSEQEGLYGRLPKEIARDQRIKNEVYLNEHELGTVATLCDIILPATPTAGSANDAGVPDFIEFIVKDIPSHQIPMRGGLMWLDQESNRRFAKAFSALSDAQQIEIVDDIAYPDPDGKKPNMSQGIAFFNLMRNLTLTGYYTTKMGFDDLGYQGNRANIWDGVPEDVLAEHNMSYDPEWIARCVDQSKRDVTAAWDDDGNLIT
ncbi:MAG: gluconate 2-dehydrogenase subunit 3 family protein [Bacteroidota bacterium]